MYMDPFEPFRESQRNLREAVRKATTIQMPKMIDAQKIATQIQPDMSVFYKAAHPDWSAIQEAISVDSEALARAFSFQSQMPDISKAFSTSISEAIADLNTSFGGNVSDYYYSTRAADSLEEAVSELEVYRDGDEVEEVELKQKFQRIEKAIYEHLGIPELFDNTKESDLSQLYLLIVFALKVYALTGTVYDVYNFTVFLVTLLQSVL